jgi:hypothetical protein
MSTYTQIGGHSRILPAVHLSALHEAVLPILIRRSADRAVAEPPAPVRVGATRSWSVWSGR